MPRIEPDLREEMALYNQGYRLIAGLDEAGRGSWAGPVVAGAVILPLDAPDLVERLEGVRDSKELTPRQRDRLFERIRATALAIGVGIVSPTLIDVLGIVPATRLAMGAALRNLPLPPDALLIDGLPLSACRLSKWLVNGDRLCLSIAAASIVAKVTRDRLMVELEAIHPGY
ncbi:MAG TPA: ribonuclease HII, partial [Anaerolineae bacterium]|nr:ribonuclease HII [Anaerolineae bacterium]